MVYLKGKHKKPGYQPGMHLKTINFIMTIQAPSAANQLALTLEQFIGKAEAFLQNHYVVGSDSADIQTILKAIADLRLDIDSERLEQEFELTQERQDLMGDYYDSSWF